MDLAIIPECFVDTNLVETLVPPVRHNKRQGYNHQKGCGTVVLRMKKQFADSFALGIIDKDKNEIDYLKEFTEICSDDLLALHKHTIKSHYIIQIKPAIERFILANAMAAGISVEDFGLPVDFDKFKKEAKSENSKKDERFKRLFKKLYTSGAPGIQKLAAWIKYLRENNYTADINEIKRL